MIRFILRGKRFSELDGLRTEGLFTHDIECPELEVLLREGGRGGGGYHINELVGAEVLPDPAIPRHGKTEP